MANLKEIAAKQFAKDKDLDKVFITTDGYPFYTENAANLHKNTNSKKEMKVYSFSREVEGESTDKSIDKMKKDELIAYAASNKIDISEASNNDERVAVIKEAMKSKKAE